MSQQLATFKGDVKLIIDNDGDLDINLQNGQPEMTEFIDTLVLLYTYGEDSWYNATVSEESEKMKSRFPELLRTAPVSDQTIADGIKFLTEALNPLITDKIAKNVLVEGEIFSVYGIKWTVNIERYDGEDSRFSVLWEKGFSQLEQL